MVAALSRRSRFGVWGDCGEAACGVSAAADGLRYAKASMWEWIPIRLRSGQASASVGMTDTAGGRASAASYRSNGPQETAMFGGGGCAGYAGCKAALPRTATAGGDCEPSPPYRSRLRRLGWRGHASPTERPTAWAGGTLLPYEKPDQKRRAATAGGFGSPSSVLTASSLPKQRNCGKGD